MANTKLPARLLDTSEVPNLNISGTGLGIGTTSTNALINLVEDNSRSSKTGTAQGQIHISGGTDLSNGDVSGITFSTNSLAQVSSIIGNTITNSGSSLFFGTSNNYASGVTNTALLIDHAGTVGIGTSSPSQRLHVDGGNALIKTSYDANGTTNSYLYFAARQSGNWRNSTIGNTGNALVFSTGGTGTTHTNATERARIDSGGNFLVGQTSVNYNAVGSSIANNGILRVCRDGDLVAAFNRKSSFGYMINLYKDGSSIGTIGAYTTERMYMGSGDTGIVFSPSHDAIYPINASTPAARSDAIDLGILDAKFDDVYANGTVNFSDRNGKNTITDSDLGLDFVKRLSPVSYKFNHGESGRTHYGLIAQDIETVLSDINKPTTDFAGFIKGDISEEQDGSSYGYGLRYHEFISPLIKAIQEQQTIIDDLKTRIETLEG